MLGEAEHRVDEHAAEPRVPVGLRGGVDAADAVVQTQVADVLARRVVITEQAEPVGIGTAHVDL